MVSIFQAERLLFQVQEYLNEGKEVEAIQPFKNVVSLAPEKIPYELWITMGVICHRYGHTIDMDRYFKQAIYAGLKYPHQKITSRPPRQPPSIR